MLTQRHDETADKAATTSSDEPILFRAATLDEAVELAEKSLGARTRVIAANQLRRGGIGGFFASDLGVEISVVVEEETVEEALARIVDDAAAEERELWRDRSDTHAVPALREAHAVAAAQVGQTVQDFEAARDFQAIDDFLATDSVHAFHAAPAAPAAQAAQPGPVLGAMPSSRFEQALRSFEAETSAMETELVEEFRPYLPTRTQRVSRLAAPAAEHAPVPAPVLTPERVGRIEAAYASLQPTAATISAPTTAAPHHSTDEVAGQAVSTAAVAAAEASSAPGKGPGPSRRQTELVVAATEQLIDTLSSRGAAAQYSVRVVMRGSHGIELETFASFDTRVAGDQS